MQKFIGRKPELDALERQYKGDSGFVVIYGRRRVGKTTLIKEFMKTKNAFYFLATEEIEHENMKTFARDFARFSSQDFLAEAKFSSWDKLFEAFVAYKPNEKKVLVIDEFQYLIGVNPAFASIFQRIWDTILQDHNVMVILCGSLISMMLKQVLSYQSPLYGRRTSQIRLSPLNFNEVCEYFSGKTFEEQVKLYSVTGGVPKYIELFDNNLSLMENIKNQILQKDGFLFEEPTFLLEKEVKETVSYFSIIKTIAAGNHKLSAISGSLEMKSTGVTPYLKTLIDLDIIGKRVPATENNPEKSRKGLYYIKDNFIEFWFKFVAPFKSELEIGNTKVVTNKLERNFIDTHTSFAFEDVSRQNLRDSALTYSWSRIGSYWDNNSEVDICAIDDENKVCMLGECKFLDNPVDADVYFEITQKSEMIREPKDYTKIYALFSKSNYTKRMLDIAKNNDSIVLFNNGRIL